MIKLAVTVVAIGGMVAAAAWGINSYLHVDDLKDCAAPDYATPNCAPADVIVAISGGDTQARTTEAVALYKTGWAPKIIFSGAALDTSGPSNAEAMRKQALASGIPDEDILLDTKSADTAQNAAGTLALLTSGEKRIILVTSPYHQRRASLEFGHALGDRVTIINHPTQSDRSWGQYWWATPNGWLIGLTETAKTMVVSAWR